MGIITKIEDKLGSIIEKPFRDKNTLEPLIIEVTVKRKLEAKKKNILGKLVVPDSVSIIFDERVYNEFKPFFDHFKDALARSLSEWTKENGYEILQELNLEFKKGFVDERKFDIVVSFRRSGDNTRGEEASSSQPPKNSLSQEGCGQAAVAEIKRNPKSGEKTAAGSLLNITTGESYEVYEGETIMGRDEDCDVTINDPTISRIHAFILSKNGKFTIEDLGSASGTRVSHEKIRRIVLAEGDRIIIGDTELIVTIYK